MDNLWKFKAAMVGVSCTGLSVIYRIVYVVQGPNGFLSIGQYNDFLWLCRAKLEQFAWKFDFGFAFELDSTYKRAKLKGSFELAKFKWQNVEVPLDTVKQMHCDLYNSLGICVPSHVLGGFLETIHNAVCFI